MNMKMFSIVFLVLAGLLANVAFAQVSHGISACGVVINSTNITQTINSAGNNITIFNLTASLQATSGNCILINTSNITINMRGFHINISGAKASAFLLSSANHTKIANGSIYNLSSGASAIIADDDEIDMTSNVSVTNLSISNFSTANDLINIFNLTRVVNWTFRNINVSNANGSVNVFKISNSTGGNFTNLEIMDSLLGQGSTNISATMVNLSINGSLNYTSGLPYVNLTNVTFNQTRVDLRLYGNVTVKVQTFFGTAPTGRSSAFNTLLNITNGSNANASEVQANLTIYYSDGDISGLDESGFLIAYYNNSEWIQPIPVSNAVPASNYVVVRNLGVFGPFGIFGIRTSTTTVSSADTTTATAQSLPSIGTPTLQCPDNKYKGGFDQSTSWKVMFNLNAIASGSGEEYTFDNKGAGTYYVYAPETSASNYKVFDLSSTCAAAVEETVPPVEEVTPETPTEEAQPTEETTPEQPAEDVSAKAVAAVANAVSAIDEAKAAGKDVSAAQAKLTAAQVALNSGNFEEAARLAAEAAQLARSAPAKVTAPVKETTKPKVEEKPSAPAPSGELPLLPIAIVLLVVIVAAAYFLFMRGGKKGYYRA